MGRCLFFIPLLFAITPLWSFGLGGWAPWTTVAIAFFLIPLADLVWPNDSTGPWPKGDSFFNGILYSYVPIHLSLVLWGAWQFSTTGHSPVASTGLILSVGIVTGGVGITFAHELVHRRSRLQRFLGELLLVFVCYGHFAVAHVLGHHRNVGTPKDPATAPKNMNVYRFYVRALPGVFLEALHLRKRQTVIYSLASLGIAFVLTLWLGPKALLFFFGQSLVAALLLETVDYIEHYGLTRKEISPGRYELVGPQHSWDSRALISGKLLIHLQRHSDHHLHVLKPYPTLALIQNPSQLPTGYAGLLILALIPPLWFRVMNPRIGKNS